MVVVVVVGGVVAFVSRVVWRTKEDHRTSMKHTYHHVAFWREDGPMLGKYRSGPGPGDLDLA